jgi:Tol biopolymer transport system component
MAAAGVGRGRWASIAVVACVSIGAGAADPAPGGPDRLALVEETAGGQDVLVVDVSRGTVTRAARGLTEIDRLVWSPDGGRLALGGKSGGRHGIFIARTDGSAPQRVADGRSPSWSPDGTRIAFAAPQDGGEEIFVVRVDSGAQDRLTASPGRDIMPLWAPDGGRIAFASGRSESSRLHGREYGTEIHLMGADGSGARALTGGNACGLATESEGKLNSLDHADWTPDGRRLVYRAGVCKMDCRVCVVDVDAGRTRPLVAERMVAAFALAPDGRSVAYAWDRQILLVDLDGNGRRPLVQAGWGPAWSRDGRRIAFLTADEPDSAARRYHVETIEPDGRNRRRVTQRSGNYWGLAWAPVPTGRP